MRITGLASGMDIDSMVKELMKAKRSSYDKMVQTRTLKEWAREDYKTLNSKIVDFRNNKIGSYNLSNAIQAKKAEVTGNSDALTVNSVNSTASGVLNVEVTGVAKAANKVFEYSGSKDLSTATLEQLGFTVNGSDNVTVTVNGVGVTLSKDAKLSDLAAKINSDKNTKATALFSGTTFSITNTQTGKSPTTITGLPSPDFAVSSSYDGADAAVKINGIEFKQANNKFDLNGFNFTIKAESTPGAATSIQAVTDTSKIVETIKSFVADYNSLVSSINTELSEEKFRKYAPLSDDQKKELSDDEVKLWQEKARSGTLKNDSMLSSYVADLRIATLSLVGGIETGEVDSKGDAVRMSIGITTGTYSEKGKLYLDETKLIAALEKDPDKVTALFTARSSDTSPGSKTSGIFAKINDASSETLNLIAKKAGTSPTNAETNYTLMDSSLMGDQLREMKNRETAMLSRLTTMETNYYKIFAAMETAINKYNSQSSSLSSFISG
jgi:flagellar hook-associated protein 2